MFHLNENETSSMKQGKIKFKKNVVKKIIKNSVDDTLYETTRMYCCCEHLHLLRIFETLPLN